MADKNLNPYKYCNRKSIDGTPLKEGEVLVPVRLPDGYQIPVEFQSNTTTWHYGEIELRIAFMPYPIEDYASYIKEFNKGINDYLAECRKGRCIIGYKPNGEPILCPKSRKCTGCPEKNTHERYNPKRDQCKTISLDYTYEKEKFDYVDPNAIDPLDLIIAKEAETFDEVKTKALKHLEKKDARYAQVIRLELEGKTKKEIYTAINLHSSRGREVINEANDAICDFVLIPHMKTDHRKKKK